MPENQILTEDEMRELSQDELLAMFVEQIIRENGGEVTDELRDGLVEQLNDWINIRLLKAMPDEAVEGLNALLDDPNTTDEQIDKAISDSGVDIDKVVTETMMEFRRAFLSLEKGGKNE